MRNKQTTVLRPITPQEWLKQNFKNYPATQREMARELGFKSHNSVNLWLTGRQAIPMKHAITMAKKFGVDPIYARNLVLYDMYPDDEMWGYDERIRLLGNLSANELEFLEILRTSAKRNPKMTEAQKAKFKEFVDSLSEDENVQAGE